MEFFYLLINSATLLLTFALSFHPALRFYKQWNAALPAILLTAIPFILWDMLFTSAGIWSFNPVYLTGLYIGNLPLEEILFFICIPYACLFTFHCLRNVFNSQRTAVTGIKTGWILVPLTLLTAIFYHERTYTATTFALLGMTLMFTLLTKYRDLLGRFLLSYLVLLVPFFIVNGLLTGLATPQAVVLYNQGHIIGLRLTTIPVEDAFYGMLMILTNVLIYERLLILFKNKVRLKRPDFSELSSIPVAERSRSQQSFTSTHHNPPGT